MRTVLCLLILSLGCALGAEAAWHHPLYLDGGGTWKQRIALDVRNDTNRNFDGEQATLRVGTGVGEADLAGQRAEALRVCNAKGTEMLFGLTGPTLENVTSGPIPAGSTLTIPVECPSRQTVRYWLYFDNPRAWRVPDFLNTVSGIRNGGMEQGEGNVPGGWTHDANDEQHRTYWVKETAHSGTRSLKTVVSEGAEPTWIATRQSGIRIFPGAKYTLTGWVKGKDIKGLCGWYVHVGNAEEPMLLSPMPTAGEGTFDWREVRAEFTAPAGASRADLGTVLRGTGTAWFDDVALQTDATSLVRAVASPPERLNYTEVGESPSCGRVPWDYRVPVRVANLEAQPRSTLVAADAAGFLARLQGKANTDNLTVVFDGRVIPHSRLKDVVLFSADLPANTVSTYYLCASRTAGPVAADLKAQYQAILASPRNLAKNADFELGDILPTDWPSGAEGTNPDGAVLGTAMPGLFGRRCAAIEVPANARPAWIGWRQDIPVTPGRTYLYSAWLKCEGLSGGLQLHAHLRDAKGEVCQPGGYTGAGPAISGTTDWTLISGMFDMPEDCVDFQAHLTMLATGKAWHDGVVLAEVASGEVGSFEGRSPAALTVWPVNAVVKVFQEDVPPPTIPTARVSAAREEYEPLQVAVRGPQAVSQVMVSAEVPMDAAGRRLPSPEIGVVGYVPMDHASSYYSSGTPGYYRKFPTSAGGCDGFPGIWPDPIIPRQTFDLVANQTQPVWVTFHVPADAVKGDYQGVVRLLAGGRTIAQLPYTVHVWGFALPPEQHLKAVYDVRQGDSIWQVPGKGAREVRQDFWKLMADRRVCPDRVQPDPVIRYNNGQVTADFTEYDKACEYYFNVLRLPHSYTPSIFYMFGWGFPPAAKFGEQPYDGTYPFAGADRGKLRPEYKRAYQACLRAYWDHMKQKGWSDRITLYLSDEPYNAMPEVIEQMKAICDMIHEVDARIPIYVSNWTPQPAWEGYVTVWGAGQYGNFPTEKMAELQRRGDTIWITVDGQMCTDTPYAACERLLPHYAFKYGLKAYEFWGIDWLTYNPWEFGWHQYIMQSGKPGEKPMGTRYPNGDGYLAYPGAPVGHAGAVSSIRLEQAREGQEDYEYLYLLQQAEASGRGNATVRAALAQANTLVDIPNAGGRYSTKILPRPDDVFLVKDALGRAIESLPLR